MNLKEAREIARKVGATIEEKKYDDNKVYDGKVEYETDYIIRLGVIKIGSAGVRENIVLHAQSPAEAANLACIETGRAARALFEVAKKVYTDSDLIFGAPKA